jgi:hypothetical protein
MNAPARRLVPLDIRRPNEETANPSGRSEHQWRTKEPVMIKLLPRNEHTLDRAVRVVLGIALLALVFVGPRTPWGYLGIVPLLTGLLGSCPVYTLLGIGTCPIDRKPAARS